MFLSGMKLVNLKLFWVFYPEQTIFVSNINPIKQIKFEKVLNEYNQYLWKISVYVWSSVNLTILLVLLISY